MTPFSHGSIPHGGFYSLVRNGLALLQACCIALELGFAFHHPGNSLPPSSICLRLISFFVGRRGLFSGVKPHDKGTWEEKVLSENAFPTHSLDW